MPGLIDALRAQSGGGRRGISIRGVGSDFSADVPEDDPYAARATPVSGAVSSGDFLAARIGEFDRNYRKNDIDGVLKAQEMKDAIALAAARGQAERFNDPLVRRMREDQSQSDLATIHAKSLPDRIKAQYGLEGQRLTADSRERAAVRSAKVRALASQLSNLEKLRYSGEVSEKVPGQQGSWSGLWGDGPFFDQPDQPNPERASMDARITALRRQIDSDTGEDDPFAEDDDMSAILDEMRRRGYTIP
jgi:hypothetical protein